MFIETTMTDDMQSRHNDYNYQCLPAIKRHLEKFPLKQMIFNWNALSVDLKATADFSEFTYLLKENYLKSTALKQIAKIIALVAVEIKFCFVVCICVEHPSVTIHLPFNHYT